MHIKRTLQVQEKWGLFSLLSHFFFFFCCIYGVVCVWGVRVYHLQWNWMMKWKITSDILAWCVECSFGRSILTLRRDWFSELIKFLFSFMNRYIRWRCRWKEQHKIDRRKRERERNRHEKCIPNNKELKQSLHDKWNTLRVRVSLYMGTYER